MQTETVPVNSGFRGRIDGMIASVVPGVVSRDAKIFLVGALTNGFGNGVFSAVLQLYMVSLGFKAQQLGSIFLFNSLSCTLLSIPCGIMADRYGKKKMMLASFASMTTGMILALTSKTIPYLQLAFMFIGVSNACSTMFTPLYSSFFDKDDMEKAFGLYGLLNILSMSLGSLVGYVPVMLMSRFLVSDITSYRWVMFGAGLLFMVQYFFYLTAMRGYKETLSEGFQFKLKSWRPVIKFSALSLFGNIAGGLLFSLFPFYVNQKYGVDSAGLGLLFFVSNLSMAVSKGAAAAVAKRLGNMRSTVIGLSLSAVFFLLMPLSPSFGLLSFFYILRMGTRFMSDPLLTSAFLRSVSDDEQSTANSIRMISMNAGGTVSPLLGGSLMDNVNLDSPAYIGAGLTFVLAALYPLLLRKELGEPEST